MIHGNFSKNLTPNILGGVSDNLTGLLVAAMMTIPRIGLVLSIIISKFSKILNPYASGCAGFSLA